LITINLVCVGNLKEKFSKEEQSEYLKRLSAFCRLNIIELKEQNSLENESLILEKEGEQIIEKLGSLKGFNILCDINAKEISSEAFAQEINSLMQTNSTLNFVIGGSYGTSEKLKKYVDKKISFSPMTFPHNLFRIMLLEQIYRAFMILNGKTYHK